MASRAYSSTPLSQLTRTELEEILLTCDGRGREVKAAALELLLEPLRKRGDEALNRCAAEIELRRELEFALKGTLHRLRAFPHERDTSSSEVCRAEDALAKVEAYRASEYGVSR